jgi:hypothetical protein
MCCLACGVAGYNNTLYTLSMSRNFRRRFITDFGRVEGVPGVYMANQLSPKMLNDPSALRSMDFEKFIQSKARTCPAFHQAHPRTATMLKASHASWYVMCPSLAVHLESCHAIAKVLHAMFFEGPAVRQDSRMLLSAALNGLL